MVLDHHSSEENMFPTETHKTTRIPRAALFGEADYFNYHDHQWVLGFSSATLHVDARQLAVGSMLLVLRAAAGDKPSSPDDDGGGGEACFIGSPKSDPFILLEDDGASFSSSAHGYYVKATSKKRKYRMHCVGVAMHLNGSPVVYTVEKLHVDSQFSRPPIAA
jgi:hypothetical protein